MSVVSTEMALRGQRMDESRLDGGVTSRVKGAAPFTLTPPPSPLAGSGYDLGQFRTAIYFFKPIIKMFIKEKQGFVQSV